MTHAHIKCLPLLAAAAAAAGPPDVLISELRIEQPGQDTDEFFELEGPPGRKLDGLTYLVIGDGNGADGTIEEVVNLTGVTIPDDGLLLVGESLTVLGVPADLVVHLNFENSDNVTHLLVSGFTGSLGDDLDLDNDCVLDVTPWETVLDMVALIEEPNPPEETECTYGSSWVGPPLPAAVYRCRPFGSWAAGTTDPIAGADTPGGPNLGCGDLDADGEIGVSDLLVLLSQWGDCPEGSACSAVFDGDGLVNTIDLDTLLANWS